MENLKLDNTKLNTSLNSALSLPRLSDGSLNLEAIAIGKNEKNNYIVPDEVMTNYYRELPSGTVNQSGTFTAYNGGLLKALTEEIRRKGAEALNAERAQRRSIKEILEELSKKTVTAQEAEEYGLKEGTTLLEAANLAQIRRAMKGDTKAAEYVRDTLGEKPTDKLEAELTQVTPEIEQLIKRVASRNEINEIID